MRAPALLLGLLTLGACATPALPDHSYPVFFTDNSAVIDAPAQAIILRAATAAKQFPSLPVSVDGYADSNGTPAATIALSQARADNVAAMLVSDGVPLAQIRRSAVGTPPNSQPGIESRRVVIDIGDN